MRRAVNSIKNDTWTCISWKRSHVWPRTCEEMFSTWVVREDGSQPHQRPHFTHRQAGVGSGTDECRRICGSAQSPYPHQMRPKTAPATGQNILSISSYFGKEFSLILPPGINPREILQHITKGDMHKNASQYCSQYAKPGATAQGPIHWKGAYYTAKKKCDTQQDEWLSNTIVNENGPRRLQTAWNTFIKSKTLNGKLEYRIWFNSYFR